MDRCPIILNIHQKLIPQNSNLDCNSSANFVILYGEQSDWPNAYLQFLSKGQNDEVISTWLFCKMFNIALNTASLTRNQEYLCQLASSRPSEHRRQKESSNRIAWHNQQCFIIMVIFLKSKYKHLEAAVQNSSIVNYEWNTQLIH